MAISDPALPRRIMDTGGTSITLATLRFQLVDAVTIDFLDLMLTEEERIRASRIVVEERRNLFILRRAFATAAVYLKLGFDWTMTRTTMGRPEIRTEGGSFPISISSTKGRILCALASKGEVGVDIESLADCPSDYMLIARTFFAPKEVTALEVGSEHARRQTFMILWTLKEAYLKATGIGLAGSLTSAVFSITPHGLDHDPVADNLSRQWIFSTFLDSHHAIGLARSCHANDGLELQNIEIDLPGLCEALRLYYSEKLRI